MLEGHPHAVYPQGCNLEPKDESKAFNFLEDFDIIGKGATIDMQIHNGGQDQERMRFTCIFSLFQ